MLGPTNAPDAVESDGDEVESESEDSDAYSACACPSCAPQDGHYAREFYPSDSGVESRLDALHSQRLALVREHLPNDLATIVADYTRPAFRGHVIRGIDIRPRGVPYLDMVPMVATANGRVVFGYQDWVGVWDLSTAIRYYYADHSVDNLVQLEDGRFITYNPVLWCVWELRADGIALRTDMATKTYRNGKVTIWRSFTYLSSSIGGLSDVVRSPFDADDDMNLCDVLPISGSLIAILHAGLVRVVDVDAGAILYTWDAPAADKLHGPFMRYGVARIVASCAGRRMASESGSCDPPPYTFILDPNPDIAGLDLRGDGRCLPLEGPGAPVLVLRSAGPAIVRAGAPIQVPAGFPTNNPNDIFDDEYWVLDDGRVTLRVMALGSDETPPYLPFLPAPPAIVAQAPPCWRPATAGDEVVAAEGDDELVVWNPEAGVRLRAWGFWGMAAVGDRIVAHGRDGWLYIYE